jgi:hypothetical protein
MINAFYKAGSALGWHGWDMIELVGLQRMAENREGLYDGPPVGEMDALNDQQKVILSEVLGFPLDEDSSPATYPGMVNQDMINLFYRAAGKMNQLGWTWIHRAGLQDIAASREARYRLYRGPRIADLPNLTTIEKNSLQQDLDALRS